MADKGVQQTIPLNITIKNHHNLLFKSSLFATFLFAEETQGRDLGEGTPPEEHDQDGPLSVAPRLRLGLTAA